MLYGPDNQPIASGSRRQASRLDPRAPLLASLREERLRRIIEEWRQQTSGSMPVALPPQDSLLAIAYWMFYTSGLYRAIIKNKTTVGCGDGFAWSAKDPQVQHAITGFWRDRVNALDVRIEEYSDELSAFGELFLLYYVQQSTGRLRIGQVMPWNVPRVLTDPENPQCAIGIRVGRNITIPILNGPDTAEYERRNFSAAARARRKSYTNPHAGEGLRGCVYLCVNRRVVDDGDQQDQDGPQLRGTPDLFAATDTILDAENALRDTNERVRLMNRILYDVTLEGANQEQIDEFLEKIAAVPDAYTINAHNERARWEIQTPDFKATQNRDAYEMTRNAAIASGGAGQPPTWFGEGNLTTKASAESMPFPTMKGLRRRQQLLGRMLTECIAYQLYSKGLLSAEHLDALETEDIFRLEYPTISEQDMEILMRVQTQLTASLNVGLSQGWLTHAEAARFYRSGLSEARNEELEAYEPPAQDALRDLFDRAS